MKYYFKKKVVEDINFHVQGEVGNKLVCYNVLRKFS